MNSHRSFIFDIIASSSKHLTADEIYLRAKKKEPGIAVGTIYRNLRLMTESGEIRCVSMPNLPDHFERMLHPHEHLLCTRCGAISDISVEGLQLYLTETTGIDITGYDLSLRYLCDPCKKGASGA